MVECFLLSQSSNLTVSYMVPVYKIASTTLLLLPLPATDKKAKTAILYTVPCEQGLWMRVALLLKHRQYRELTFPSLRDTHRERESTHYMLLPHIILVLLVPSMSDDSHFCYGENKGLIMKRPR